MSSERPDEISFVASIPTTAGILKIDGGANEGGEIRLSIPGTHLASLLALTTFRGKQLAVTIALQQTELDLTTRAGDVPDDQASVFGPALERQAAGLGDLPAHVHRYDEGGVYVDCGEARGADAAVRTEEIAAPSDEGQRPRKVSRGLIPRKKRAKARA